MKRMLTLCGATGMVGCGPAASGMAFAAPSGGRSFDHHGMMGCGGWLTGPVMTLIFFTLLMGTIVLVVRRLGADRPQSGDKTEDTAMTSLRHRFAKGEVSEHEYEASQKVLDGAKT